MKIRSDYVTNSSSSCFVIGKKEDEMVTIESVIYTDDNVIPDYIVEKLEDISEWYCSHM